MKAGRLAAVIMFTVVALISGSSKAAAAETAVALTFDDGLSSQHTAAAIMERHGVRGTFYINSDFLDGDGRLSVADTRAFAARGHEIGGHSELHLNLPAVDRPEQLRQICNDRVQLSRLLPDHPIRSFAYPYGAADATSRQVVRACGYVSARIVGGLWNGEGTCDVDCVGAESLPPRDRYAVRTSISFTDTSTFVEARRRILAAKRRGGGLVPFVFHDVCDGCSRLSVPPDQFDLLLRWLAAQRIRVVVMGQVIDGTPGPVVPGPSPVLREGEIPSGSLDTQAPPSGAAEIPVDSEGPLDFEEVTACWLRAGFGDNDGEWMRIVDGELTGWAEQLTMTDHRDGDRKLLLRLDSGQCTPPVTSTRRYRLVARYRSTVPVRFVTYVKPSNGRWRYWSASPYGAASERWREMTWTTPATPDGVERLSFGVAVDRVGTFAVDDLAMSVVRDRWLNGVRWLIVGLALVVIGPVLAFMLASRIRRR